jgi:hypothetical protein
MAALGWTTGARRCDNRRRRAGCGLVVCRWSRSCRHRYPAGGEEGLASSRRPPALDGSGATLGRPFPSAGDWHSTALVETLLPVRVFVARELLSAGIRSRFRSVASALEPGLDFFRLPPAQEQADGIRGARRTTASRVFGLGTKEFVPRSSALHSRPGCLSHAASPGQSLLRPTRLGWNDRRSGAGFQGAFPGHCCRCAASCSLPGRETVGLSASG